MSPSERSQARPRGRPARTQQQNEETRQKIAETAQRLFQTEGYAQVSMRRLAREVGCSPMTLYKYYDGKLAILQTLWAVVFDELFSEIKLAISAARSPPEQLRVFCKSYVGFWITNPEHYRMVFMAEGVTQSEVSLFVGSPEIAADFALFAQLIAAAAGTDDENLLQRKNDLLLAALQGIAHCKITISGYPWSTTDVMIDDLLDAIGLARNLSE